MHYGGSALPCNGRRDRVTSQNMGVMAGIHGLQGLEGVRFAVESDIDQLRGVCENDALGHSINDLSPMETKDLTSLGEGSIPRFCLCPITGEVMDDPVIVNADCRHTCSRDALHRWVTLGNMTCPCCRSPLRSKDGAPNTLLREAVEVAIGAYGRMCLSAPATSKVTDHSLTGAPTGVLISNESFSGMRTANLEESGWTGIPSFSCPKAVALVQQLWTAIRSPQVQSPSSCSLSTVARTMLGKKYSAWRVANGCRSLACFSYKNTDNQMAIAAAGGIQAIVTAIWNYRRSENVHVQACRALRNLACSAENRDKITSAGGIGALVGAMLDHPKVASVQEQACRALKNLSHNNVRNKIAIASAGGIPALIAAMHDHAGAANLQEHACRALRNLAVDNDENQVAIASAGGIVAIVEAMSCHMGVQEVQKQGCWVLKHLSNAPSNLAILRRDVPLDVLTTVALNHPAAIDNALYVQNKLVDLY